MQQDDVTRQVTTRRRILVASGAAAIGSLAGCLDILSEDETPTPGDDDNDDSDDNGDNGDNDDNDDNDALAPGITEEGLVNPIALRSAHQQALLADGFVSAATYESAADGTVQFRTTNHTSAGPSGETALQRSTSSDLDVYQSTHDAWHTATRTTIRIIENDTTEYMIRPRITTPEGLVWPGPVLTSIQQDAERFEVTSVEERDGIRFITLTADLDSDPSTMVVDERGVIHSFESTRTYGGTDTWAFTYVVEQIGDVRPEAPEWLADVPPGAELNVHLFADMLDDPEGVIALEHSGGDAVPTGTYVSLLQDDEYLQVQLSEPLQPGETLYVYLDADTGDLRAETTQPAEADVRPVASEFTIRVFTSDGVTLLEESLGWR